MNSDPGATPNEAHDPQNALTARADDELVQAFEKIKGANEQIAHVNEQLSKLERDHERRQEVRDRPALRGLIGLLLATFICATALVSQSSFGDTAKLMIADWMPIGAATPPQPQAEPVVSEQSTPAVAQAVGAESAPQQPAPSNQTVAEPVAPTAATLPPELTEQLQKLTRDVANLEQSIEQLKANHEQMKANEEQMKANEERMKVNQDQMAVDNARIAEQLKASQEQISRLVSKTSDKNRDQASLQNPRARTPPAPVPPPRPLSASASRPASTSPPTSPRVRRPAPPQLDPAQ